MANDCSGETPDAHAEGAQAFPRYAGRTRARTLTDQDISKTINFARITLIVGLIFLHYGGYPNTLRSPFDGVDIQQHQVATFLNSFVLFFFFSVVPLLSIISGWLFFSFPEGEKLPFRRRTARRFKSLYLPLVFWNGLFFILLLALYKLFPGNALTESIEFNFANANWKTYINAIFALTDRPIAFQFWFVRDLFATVLVSPILWIFLRRAPFISLTILTLVWLSGYVVPGFLRMDVPLFFYIGGLLCVRKMPLEVSLRTTVILASVYILMVAIRALAPYFLVDSTYQTSGTLAAATRAMRLVGVIACWGIFLRLSPTKLGEAVARYSSLAFFLHSAHYPLLAAVKIVLWKVTPTDTDGWMLMHYFASVIITTAIGLGTGLILARHAPGLFALFNGGRSMQ